MPANPTTTMSPNDETTQTNLSDNPRSRPIGFGCTRRSPVLASYLAPLSRSRLGSPWFNLVNLDVDHDTKVGTGNRPHLDLTSACGRRWGIVGWNLHRAAIVAAMERRAWSSGRG